MLESIAHHCNPYASQRDNFKRTLEGCEGGGVDGGGDVSFFIEPLDGKDEGEAA